jgi:hypothetical protein
VEERELLDLLVRGEEIPLDAVGDERERGFARALLLARKARADPQRELLPVDREDVDHHPGRGERTEPGRVLPCPIEARERDEREGVLRQPGAVRADRLGAVGARLAGGNAQLDDPPRREEGERCGARREPAPVVTALDEVDVALAVALGARLGADRVGSLEREQRLVAVDDVQRREAAGKVRVELVGANRERHATLRPRPAPASPARAGG